MVKTIINTVTTLLVGVIVTSISADISTVQDLKTDNNNLSKVVVKLKETFNKPCDTLSYYQNGHYQGLMEGMINCKPVQVIIHDTTTKTVNSNLHYQDEFINIFTSGDTLHWNFSNVKKRGKVNRYKINSK